MRYIYIDKHRMHPQIDNNNTTDMTVIVIRVKENFEMSSLCTMSSDPFNKFASHEERTDCLRFWLQKIYFAKKQQFC